MLLHHSVSRMQENTTHSTPSWQIKRSGVAQHDGSHRWDDAYQLLLRWVTAAEVAPPPLPVSTPEPTFRTEALIVGHFYR
jgi:hypothetical protein